MSYLRGPLTRDQIRRLMADRKADLAKQQKASSPEPEKQMPVQPAKASTRPVLSAKIVQSYWPVSARLPEGSRLQYRPAVIGESKLHFIDSSSNIDCWRDLTVLQPIHGDLPEPIWDSAYNYETVPAMDDKAEENADFTDLPSELAQEKNYKTWEKELKEHLYRSEKYTVWNCDVLNAYSESGESEGDFRIRMTQLAREKRDDKKDAVRAKYKKRIDRAREAVRKAEAYASQQKSQFWMRILDIVWRIVAMFMGNSRSRGPSTTSARQAMRERGEQTRAQQRLEEKQIDLEDLEEELQQEMEQIEFNYEPANLELEKTEVPPRKSDISVDQVQLVWLPWSIDADGISRPEY